MMASHDSINRRLGRIEQQQGTGNHGPQLVVTYTRQWRGDYGETAGMYDAALDDPDWDTYERATAVVSAREESAAFDAVIAQIRAEAIAANAPPNWVLSVRMADDGVVEACGAPWWPETTQQSQQAVWAADACWRRYPR